MQIFKYFVYYFTCMIFKIVRFEKCSDLKKRFKKLFTFEIMTLRMFRFEKCSAFENVKILKVFTLLSVYTIKLVMEAIDR